MVGSQPDADSSDDLRRRLLDAALDLLQEPDTPLDLRKVAERAGKSRTAPYLVFGKGESGGVMALRIAVAGEGARIMQRMMVEAYARGGDPFDSFQNVARAFLAFVERNPRLFRLMYGPEINAITRLGEGGFREHPEFQALLEHRDTAGQVVTEVIHDAQERGFLPEDPVHVSAGGADDALQELPSVRYLQIAWATMIGVSILREDDLLKAIGWDVSIEQGARLIAESVLGVDPGPAQEAMKTFLSSPQVSQESLGTRDAPTRPAPSPTWGLAMDSGGALSDEDDSGSLSLIDPSVESADASTAGPETLAAAARMRRSQSPPTPAEDEVTAPMMRMEGRGSAGGTFANVFRALRRATGSEEAESRPGPSAPPATPPPEPALDSPRAAFLAGGFGTSALVASSSAQETTLADALDSYTGLRRAAYSPKQLGSARILWIDDHPEWVANVAETLRHLGASVEVVDDTAAALRFLETSAQAGAPVQVVISDIKRGSDPDAGTKAIPALRELAPEAPIVFNIADYDAERGVPEGAFAITDDVDELMHLVLDALEGREG